MTCIRRTCWLFAGSVSSALAVLLISSGKLPGSNAIALLWPWCARPELSNCSRAITMMLSRSGLLVWAKSRRLAQSEAALWYQSML